jgi:hypothetical protein
MDGRWGQLPTTGFLAKQFNYLKNNANKNYVPLLFFENKYRTSSFVPVMFRMQA